MMKIAAILLALIAMSGSSRADWEFTRWGMSVAEVTAAAAGKMQLTKADSDDPAKAIYRADYQIGALRFRSRLIFQQGRLTAVSLLLTDPKQTEDLRRYLLQKYGKYREEKKPFRSGCEAYARQWDVPSENTHIMMWNHNCTQPTYLLATATYVSFAPLKTAR